MSTPTTPSDGANGAPSDRTRAPSDRTRAPSDRTKVQRIPEKAVYDREVIDAILDEALFCHLGFMSEGSPVVIPTIHARHGDVVYIHGSPGSRMLKHLRRGFEACLTVTILDGLVLARSVFEHSMNYRFSAFERG